MLFIIVVLVYILVGSIPGNVLLIIVVCCVIAWCYYKRKEQVKENEGYKFVS